MIGLDAKFRLARSMLNALLRAGGLLSGYLGCAGLLSRLPGDPLLFGSVPGARDFLFGKLLGQLTVISIVLFLDELACGLFGVRRNGLRQTISYILFAVVWSAAVYLGAPSALLPPLLFVYLLPARLMQELTAFQVEQRILVGQGGPPLLIPVVSAIVCAAVLIIDPALRTWSLIWLAAFIGLSVLAGREGSGLPRILVSLALGPTALAATADLAWHGSLRGVPSTTYASLLLGLLLAGQLLLVSPYRRWANMLLFVLALGGLLSGEGLLRLSRLDQLAQPQRVSPSFMRDTSLGWIQEDLRNSLDQMAMTQTANGFSNALASPRSGRLILVLGGSSTAGVYLPPDQRWPSLLETELRRRGFDVSVFNAGVPGYASYQMLLLLRDHLQNLNPYLVLVYAGHNDDSLLRRASMTQRQWFEMQRNALSGMPGGEVVRLQGLLARAHLYNLVVRLMILARERFNVRTISSPGEFIRNLQELENVARSRGARTIFVAEASGIDRDQAFAQAMREAAIGVSAPFLDIKPRLLEQHHWDELFIDDCHPNPDGAALMAAIMAEFIIEQHLLVAHY